MSIDQIIQILTEFVPFQEDDPVNDTEKFLYTLMEKLRETPGKEKAIPIIFHLMERYPHASFGAPGPLVHALESPGMDYEGELHASLLRRPTPLTMWMYNRIINTVKDQQLLSAHIARMKLLAKHPLADAETTAMAEDFAAYQEKRLQVR